MTAFTVSPAHRAALQLLEGLRRERAQHRDAIGYNDSRRYELPIVESRTAGSDCSYQSGPAVPHHEV
jgi:hypothetical protein